MKQQTLRSPFPSTTPPHIGNPLRTTPPAPTALDLVKQERLLKPAASQGPFAAVSGFSDGLGYTVGDRRRGIPDAASKRAADQDVATLTRLHDMAKLSNLYDDVEGQLKQQAEAGLDLKAFDLAGNEIARQAIANPMLDAQTRQKLAPMIDQMVSLHREGLRQRVIDSHRQEADGVVAKAIERHDADAMALAGRVGQSAPSSAERESLLRALADKQRFIEEMRDARSSLDDEERGHQRDVFQQRLALAQHEAALRHAHRTGGAAAAQSYLDALQQDASVPDALRPALMRRLGIDLAQLEDFRLTKEVRGLRRQAHDALSEFRQIRTGEPLPPFEDDHTDATDEAAFEIWRPYDRWDRSPTDIPESAYRILEDRFNANRGLSAAERDEIQHRIHLWRIDPNEMVRWMDEEGRQDPGPQLLNANFDPGDDEQSTPRDAMLD